MARILIIDDEEPIRKMLMKALERVKHEVYQADNGKSGLRQCAQTPIDLVITDIVMPDGEGLETIMQLKQMHPGLIIFAMSGAQFNMGLDVLALASSLGATRIFQKPFGMDEMVTAIAEELLSATQ
jgi:DNA-binding NtrC family response regulator